MTGTFDLSTQEDFKAVIEFLVEKNFGDKGVFYQMLLDLGYAFGLNEDYTDLDNIIDFGYDEAEGEEYYNWYNFDDIDPKSKEFFLGKYYIDIGKDWDRTGDIEYRLFVKLEDSPMRGVGFVEKYNELIAIKDPLAKKLGTFDKYRYK